MEPKKPNLASPYSIVLIYAVVIAALVIYLFFMQQFGAKGMQFHLSGRDQSITILDIAIITATVIALFLLFISLMAFRKKPDMRLFLISMAFFFFALKEFLAFFENFFPEEYIFIDNAERGLELLMLVTFILLLYKR